MGAVCCMQGTKDLTCVSNNAGVDNFGLGVLLRTKQARLRFTVVEGVSGLRGHL